MGTSTNYLVLKELAGNPPVALDPIQQLLAPHIQQITDFWVAVWCVTAVVVLVKAVRDHLNR